MREMFGIARMQTNLNKFTVKDKATVTDNLREKKKKNHVIFSGETELFNQKERMSTI